MFLRSPDSLPADLDPQNLPLTPFLRVEVFSVTRDSACRPR
jgi:hypothetical protein